VCDCEAARGRRAQPPIFDEIATGSYDHDRAVPPTKRQAFLKLISLGVGITFGEVNSARVDRLHTETNDPLRVGDLPIFPNNGGFLVLPFHHLVPWRVAHHV